MFKIIQSFQLSESISHLEDLGVEDFLKRVENIADLVATEKLDGANLYFGLDNDGKFYTSRAGKGGTDLYHSESEYVERAASNGFKAAHAALEKQEKEIKKILSAGEAVEIEVIFGRQPNAVVYGADGLNFIAFLRAVHGTDKSLTPDQSKIEQLAKSLHDKSSRVKTVMVDTMDGVNLRKVPTVTDWKFISTQEVDSKELAGIDVKPELKKLKTFLNKKNSVAKDVGLDLTNFEVSVANLGKIDKTKREEIKRERDHINQTIMNDFKLPIKEKLLSDFVRKIKPKLQAEKTSSEEDIGVEGVVLRDPKTDDLIKIVDKDVFTSINKFNFAIRNQISGLVKTDDPLADAEMRGGLFGEAKIRIASLFGIPGLARSASAKKVFDKVKGKTSVETVQNFVKDLGDVDLQVYKTKIAAILDNLLKDLDEKLTTFKKESDSYELELKSGKKIKYSPEIVRRTLLSFAELNTEITDLSKAVKKAKSLNELVFLIYKNPIDSAHNAEAVQESLMSIFEGVTPSMSILRGMSHDGICNAFFSTFLASLLLLKSGDKKAASILHDATNAKLKKYTKTMSPLTFWGLALFYPDHKDVKLHLDPYVFKELNKTAKRIIVSRIKKIVEPISSGHNLVQDWHMQRQNMDLLTLRLENSSDNINIIKDGITNWDDLALGDRNTVVSKVFYFLLQGAPTSPLLPRIRALSNRILLTANKEIQPEEKEEMEKENMKQEGLLRFVNNYLLLEDEVAVGTTSSAAIASYPQRLFGEKSMIKRTRPNTKKKKVGFELLSKVSEDGEASNMADPKKYIDLPVAAKGLETKNFRFYKGKVIQAIKRTFKIKPAFSKPEESTNEENNVK